MHSLLFVIDQLAPGGAQRQMVSLALGLLANGHHIELFNYYPEQRFFRHDLEQVGITIHDCPKGKKGFSTNVLLTLKRLLKTGRFDAALSFLDTPSTYLLLAGLGEKTKLIVSDRSSYLRFNEYVCALKRQLFHLADAVVANSSTQRDWLINGAKLPTRKMHIILNGYNFYDFQSRPNFPDSVRDIKLIAIGRINPVKNIENLIAALDIFHAKYGRCPTLTWVGRSDTPAYEKKILNLLNQHPQVNNIWSWAGERHDIPQLLAEHHALILPSLFEGLPNVVCEAMMAGKPVLASNVCDNSVLIKENERGFLFDPNNPHCIVRAIEKLTNLNNEDWKLISIKTRRYAILNLSLQKMVTAYENLFNSLVID